MKVLVAIAYFGTTNAPYVRQLLDEYAAMSLDVEVVVLTEAPKELGAVEQRVGLPTPDPYSLPFAHKPLFLERQRDYDLFIYSEDDTLISERSIEAFMWATDVLPPRAIAGFLRTEEAADGSLRCSSASGRFHWRPESAFAAGGEVFGEFTNPHGAAYMLTKAQLATAISSGGFTSPVRQGRFSMRVTAATDPYTSCGFTKAVCVSRLDDFLLPHLSNRYVATDLGISLGEFRDQASQLCKVVSGEISSDRLLSPTARLDDDARWDMNYWSPADPGALDAVGPSARSVLSFGIGDGATEALLVERGVDVTGIPLDEVIALTARHRGIETTPPDLPSALDSLGHRRFDAALALASIHHTAAPTATLRELRTALHSGANVYATFPNPRREWFRWLARRTPRPPRGGYDRIGVHLVGPRDVAAWFRQAGFQDVAVRYPVAGWKSRMGLSSIVSPSLTVQARAVEQRSQREPFRGRRPRVSVGIPVFNGDNYLEHALHSILTQTMDDFELIVCDNASTDRTEQICRAAAAQDHRVRYVRHEQNLGAARNYNECFRRSRGEFFTWLAHDDTRAPTFLERCVASFNSVGGESAVLVYPRADFIDESGIARAPDTYGVETRAASSHARLGVAVADTGAVNPIFGLIRSSALEQTRLIAPFVASDRVLLAELAVLGGLHEVPETLSHRRLHPQMSTNVNPGKVERTAWFDPEARASRLGDAQLLVREYLRSTLTLPLSIRERALCLLTVPYKMTIKRSRIVLGRWRNRYVTRNSDR